MSEEYLQSILDGCNDLSLSESERWAYEGLLKQFNDKEAAINEAKWREQMAYVKGFEEGFQRVFKVENEEDRQIMKIRIAENMLKENLDIELIVEVTKLSTERIQELKQEQGL